ncbi:MAG: 3-dehydroquinate synthase [Chromatiales bacterium]|nr:3-dehydroquinate synthase [Chromatiales bacterium]
MNTLKVELGQRSYPIHIGRGLLEQVDALLTTNWQGTHIVILSDDTVAPLYMQVVCDAIAPAHKVDKIIIPTGEMHKTLQTFEQVCSQLLHHRTERDALLVALGGGVVGDIAGFVAASYQRGIAFAQIPTTLLAQVDSSVGGKTGVNHALGKNMIGAFYQPCCVITDLQTLTTLPPRHYIAGLAEVVKYGLIMDVDFFTWLEDNVDALLSHDDGALSYAIEHSCALKAQIVAADEHEQSGKRTLLNLGHTFGHAIETTTGYGQWLHGEAVGCGLVLAAQLSASAGYLSEKSVYRIFSLLKRLGLPTSIPHTLNSQTLLDVMVLDKKNKSGRRHYILLRAIGDAFESDSVEYDVVKGVLDNAPNND